MNKYLNPITGEMNTLNLENPEPGIYAKVSHEDYLAIKAESRSGIANFREAPEKYLKPSTSISDAMTLGTQYHAYVFEPQSFKDRFVCGDVTEKGIRGKAFRAQQEEHGIEYVYRPKDLEQIEAMYEALSKYKKAHSILANENPKELTVIFHHAESDLICKVKIDILINDAGWIIDLKTTRDARRDKFKWSIRDYNYDLQSGFYVMACQATKGLEHVNNFAIVAQEKEYPYMVRSYRMDEHINDGIVESNRLLVELANWKRDGYPLPDGMDMMEKYSL